MSQGREVFGRLTVEENLRMSLACRPAHSARAVRAASRPRADAHAARRQPAIARALAPGLKLLVLDEPTEGIQPSIIKGIGRVIRQLAACGDMAILLCEQYYDFAETLADEYLVMKRGALIAHGPGAEMTARGIGPFEAAPHKGA